jgi:hypothetical protein
MNYSWGDSDFIANDTKESNRLVSHNLTTTSILNLNQSDEKGDLNIQSVRIFGFQKSICFKLLKRTDIGTSPL